MTLMERLCEVVGHRYFLWWSIEDTATGEGIGEEVCARCGEERQVTKSQ